MKKLRKACSIVIALLFVVILFTGCGGSNRYEKKLAGSWYEEGRSSPAFTLYSDGTCDIYHIYGTGTWAIVNENQLKVTDFYGSSWVRTIVSIKGGCLTMRTAGGFTVQMWNSPQE